MICAGQKEVDVYIEQSGMPSPLTGEGKGMSLGHEKACI